MKLTNAKFCVDCEEIFEGPGDCPICGESVCSVSLSHWLRSLQCPEGMSYLAHRLEANPQSAIRNPQSEAVAS